MKLLRMILGVLGVILVVWFALPLCLSAGLNIGNITGIVLGALLLLYAIFAPRVNMCLNSWRQHHIKKWIFWVLVAVVTVIAVLVVIESACMIRAACRKPDADLTVVVLGCRVYGERASLSLQERLEAAYEYLREHPDAKCVLSGGQGKGENISEAECMYRYLVDKGIEPSRLYRETQSTTTRENLYYSMQMIKENGLNPKIAIATSEYHEYRAGKIAESLDLEYAAVPAHTAIWLFPTYYVRELYAILYEWVFIKR